MQAGNLKCPDKADRLRLMLLLYRFSDEIKKPHTRGRYTRLGARLASCVLGFDYSYFFGGSMGHKSGICFSSSRSCSGVRFLILSVIVRASSTASRLPRAFSSAVRALVWIGLSDNLITRLSKLCIGMTSRSEAYISIFTKWPSLVTGSSG